jgi:putative transposase
MNQIDQEYTKHPFYGTRRITAWLQKQGHKVNRKRVQRLMRVMGLEGICPKKNVSRGDKRHKIYPYLLRDLVIQQPNQVWSTDITYVKMRSGFMYLTSVMDWYSRYVLSWRLSNTLEQSFCLNALEEALEKGKPEIFNTDQGSQFTSEQYTGVLEKAKIQISMDGRGRALDNIFIERLWRSVKYEEIYLKEYESVKCLCTGLKTYFEFYNKERLHQSLGYQTPEQVHFLSRNFSP